MTNQTQTLLQNAEQARQAFFTLARRTVPVPPAQVFAAQRLIRQTQEAIRANRK